MANEIKIRNLIILEDDLKKKIDVEGEEFIVRAILEPDNIQIARQKAMLMGGVPAASFTDEDLYIIERNATLQVCVDSGPAWWEGPLQCPISDVLNTLYNAAIEWTRDFQAALKKNRLASRGPETAVPS